MQISQQSVEECWNPPFVNERAPRSQNPTNYGGYTLTKKNGNSGEEVYFNILVVPSSEGLLYPIIPIHGLPTFSLQ
jgi:hypothetical protein